MVRPTTLSIRDAAQRLGVQPYTLGRLVRLGEVKALRLPRSRPRIPTQELERLAREAMQPVGGPNRAH
jgi:excisionase family DNA binding protein